MCAAQSQNDCLQAVMQCMASKHFGMCTPEESSGLVDILLSPLSCDKSLQQVSHAIEDESRVTLIFVIAMAKLCILESPFLQVN